MNKDEMYKLIDIIDEKLCNKYNVNCCECICGANDYMGNSICAISLISEAFSELLKDGLDISNLKEDNDNPPLKFEELKEDTWVWDNKYKTYYVIKKIGKGKSIFARYNRFVVNEFTDELEEADCGWMGSFEENRFYRKEVKE